MPSQKTCFLISPIGAEKSEERKRSDQVLRFIVTPACTECGYSVTRADQIQEPGVITSQIVQHVLDSDLLIADLTGWNPNVFYEFAIRHAFRRPYVQIIERAQRIPFDVAGIRTIQWDHHDLDSVEQCKVDIISSIRAIEKDPSAIESPVSVAVDIQSMRRSGNPLEQSIADIRQDLGRFQQRFDELSSALGSLKAPQYSAFFGDYGVTPNVVAGATNFALNPSGNLSFVMPNAVRTEAIGEPISVASARKLINTAAKTIGEGKAKNGLRDDKKEEKKDK